MSPRIIPPDEIAPDGLPKVDVIELSTAILHEGSRKETMVSQREIRALAGYALEVNDALNTAAQAIFMIEFIGTKDTPGVRRVMSDLLHRLRRQLEAMNYIGEGHEEALKSVIFGDTTGAAQ